MTETMRAVFIPLMIVSSILAFAGWLPAQTTGKVEGFVRDADTGKPLAGAQVLVEGTLLGNITDDEGYYFILNVPVGLRRIKAQLIGYQTVTVEDQRVLAGQTHTVDFNLNSTVIELPGQVVEGEREPLVPRDNTISKHRITFEATQTLPVDSYRDIVTLQAGVLNYGGSTSIRGGRTSDNAVYIDGVSVRGFLNIPEYSVEEIDVITGGFGSEFGNAQSGVINIVTREGETDLSGQLRIETDEFNPSSSNYGYNRGQFSIGGPVPLADNLTFFFSSDLLGEGDKDPRAAGFKGTTGDLFDVAARYSNADEVRRFLGHDLDILGMLRAARRENPVLPILNLTDLRRERFGGRDYEGRRPGNRGDEYQIQGKISYQPAKNIKITGTYIENRDQGLGFSMGRIFWTEEKNSASINRNRIGIVGYDQMLSQSAERSTHISFRGSFQRHVHHSGSLFAPYDSSSARVGVPGASLGYHARSSLLNFMFRDIPIFASDVWATSPGQAEQFSGVIPPSTVKGDNPFGLSTAFADANLGFVDNVSNTLEDMTTFRIDLDSQLNRVHRFRVGAETRVWLRDKYSSNLSQSTFLDYSRTNPDLESSYIEDRLDYRDLVIDLGLRLDSFNAGVTYPSIFGDQSSPRVRASRKTEVSPRLGVAHPVTERTQVRLSYGTKIQAPGFGNLYDGLNVDIGQQGNTNAFFGNPELGFQKATSFEVGFTALLSENWVLDLVGYNRDFEGNLAARYLKQEGSTRYLRILTNADFGNVRGMDVTLRKRFGGYFSSDFTYTLTFSNSTGTDPRDFVNNEGRFVVGSEPPLPPIQIAPNNFDQTHTLNAQFNMRLPDDFREGSRLGKIFENTAAYFTFQANSGRPYTRQDMNFDFAEDINMSRRGWQSMANLRLTRDFHLAGLDYTAFADIRNLFDTDNLSARGAVVFASAGVSNGVYQTTGSPYTDGKTISDAIDFLGISTPEFYVGPEARTPTDINGDGVRDEADRAEIIRRLDMNGDGTVTMDEELAMAILAMGAHDANPDNFDIPRLFRLGLEVRF